MKYFAYLVVASSTRSLSDDLNKTDTASTYLSDSTGSLRDFIVSDGDEEYLPSFSQFTSPTLSLQGSPEGYRLVRQGSPSSFSSKDSQSTSICSGPYLDQSKWDSKQEHNILSHNLVSIFTGLNLITNTLQRLEEDIRTIKLEVEALNYS